MNKTPIIIASTVALIAIGGFAVAQQTQGTLSSNTTAEATQNGDAPVAERSVKYDHDGECDRRGKRKGKHRHGDDDRDGGRYDDTRDDDRERLNRDEGGASAPGSTDQAT